MPSRYQQNGWILLQALKAVVWFTFQVEERSAKFVDDGTIALLLMTWRTYLLHDQVVVLTFLNFMVFLPTQSFAIMRNNSFDDVIKSVIERFPDNQAIEIYGKALLTKVIHARGSEARGSDDAKESEAAHDMRQRQAVELRKKQVEDIRARQAIENEMQARRRSAEEAMQQTEENGSEWSHEAELEHAAVVIQTANRRKHSQLRVEEMREQNEAATKIQAIKRRKDAQSKVAMMVIGESGSHDVEAEVDDFNPLVTFVRIEHAHMWLHVSRVEVYDENGENVALVSKGASADASSVAYKGDNTMPIDGHVRTEGWPSGCHTNNGPYEWYEVCLAKPTIVTRVVVVNRVDACYDRLTGARVVLLDADREEINIMGRMGNGDVPKSSMMFLTSGREPQQFLFS